MPKLQEKSPKKINYFRSDSGRRMQKLSGDEISESDIKIFNVPDFLLEKQPKNLKNKTILKNPDHQKPKKTRIS